VGSPPFVGLSTGAVGLSSLYAANCDITCNQVAHLHEQVVTTPYPSIASHALVVSDMQQHHKLDAHSDAGGIGNTNH
jgi:hypothetical protein